MEKEKAQRNEMIKDVQNQTDLNKNREPIQKNWKLQKKKKKRDIIGYVLM